MAQILYFSWVRETIGKSEESFSLPQGVTTVSALIDHLATRGENYARAFAKQDAIRIAVNQVHVKPDHNVTNSDEIAFFPPVTGG
ncbi:molybdopterin converting factor subunit 1 [Kordiimonas sp.]|uniref:molybdopterin converting factor subunit 1 n=1 Tax=Kordiimonas sp. TaxID=1970157 RepID=UPI003A936EFC